MLPTGTVRWETEARAWAENYGGIRVLDDVNADSIERLAQDRWELSHMGAEIARSIGRLVEVVSQSGLSRAQENSFIGWLVKQAAGVDCSDTSRATQAKYRRLQRELGIAAPADLGSMIEVVRRLDWGSGPRGRRRQGCIGPCQLAGGAVPPPARPDRALAPGGRHAGPDGTEAG